MHLVLSPQCLRDRSRDKCVREDNASAHNHFPFQAGTRNREVIANPMPPDISICCATPSHATESMPNIIMIDLAVLALCGRVFIGSYMVTTLIGWSNKRVSGLSFLCKFFVSRCRQSLTSLEFLCDRQAQTDRCEADGTESAFSKRCPIAQVSSGNTKRPLEGEAWFAAASPCAETGRCGATLSAKDVKLSHSWMQASTERRPSTKSGSTRLRTSDIWK